MMVIIYLFLYFHNDHMRHKYYLYFLNYNFFIKIPVKFNLQNLCLKSNSPSLSNKSIPESFLSFEFI